MNKLEVARMPYGLAAILVLVMTPIGLLWSSMGSTGEGSTGLLAGIVIAVGFGLTNYFVHRLMVRKGFREERDREPVSIGELAWLFALVCFLGAMALYSGKAAFIGFLSVLLVWAAADLWSRRKLSK